MSFPTAYSLELKQELTAKEAHDFSLLPLGNPNRLSDRYQFQCSKSCSFKLTLTNFAEPNYTKAPYFTSGARNQIHDPHNCQLMIKHYQEREQETQIKNYGSFSREKNKLIIDLNLVRGVLATIARPRQKDEETNPTKATVPQFHHHGNNNPVDERTFRSHIKQLSTLVRYFLDYQSGEKYTFYNMDRQEIQLEKYFVSLARAKQKGVNLEEVHIYYDTATVDYHLDKDNPDNNYFLIRFQHICSINNINNRPTIIINETKSQHHGVGYKIKILRRAAKDREPLKVFFFGSFMKHPSRKFINPKVNPTDILDYLVFS